MKNYNFSKMSKLVIKNSKNIVIFVFLITIIFFYFAIQVKVDADILRIIPEDSPIALDYRAEQKAIMGAESMVIAFFLNEDSEPLEIAVKMNDLMASIPSFNGFTETDLNFLLSYGFINPGDIRVIEELSNNLTDLLNSLQTSNPYSFGIFEFINDSLTGINKLEESLSKDQTLNYLKSFYAVSPDNKVMIMGLTFDEPATNINFTNSIIPEIRNRLKLIEEKFNIETGATSDYIIQYTSNKTVQEDFQLTTIISITLIVAVFILSFGSFVTTGIVLLGLLVSTFITLGISQILFSELNVITSFVMAITLGLGIDYGIHIVTRLNNEYKDSNDFEKSLELTYQSVFFPLLFAIISTIIVFLSLLLMGLPAFNEMGLMSSIGLLIFFFIMVFFVPSFLYLMKRHIKIGGFIIHVNRAFKKIGYFLPKNGKKISFILIPISILFIFGVFNVFKFSYTPPGMIASDSEPEYIARRIAYHYGGMNLETIKFLVKVEEDIEEYIRLLNSYETVESVENFTEMIENQIGSYSDLQTQITNYSQVIKNPIVISVLKKYNMYSDSLLIIDIASRSKDLQQFSLNITEILPEELKSNFFFERDNNRYIILNVNPSVRIWRDNGLKYFFDDIGDDKDRVLGLSKASYKVMDMIRLKFLIPLIFSFASIGIVTYISRKNIKEALGAFIGLLLATTASFGVGYFLKIDATFVTLLSFPLIFGIGVDGYIHIFHAIDDDKKHYWHTLKSVTLSFLTSSLSFLSFQLARGDLLKHFSLNMVLSILFTWLLTVILIPSLNRKKLIGQWNT